MANMNNVILFVVVIVTGWSMSAASTNCCNGASGSCAKACKSLFASHPTRKKNLLQRVKKNCRMGERHIFECARKDVLSGDKHLRCCLLAKEAPCTKRCRREVLSNKSVEGGINGIISACKDPFKQQRNNEMWSCFLQSHETKTSRPTSVSTPKKFSALLTKVQGVFTSPNYPNPYPQGIKHDWIIQLPDSYKMIRITIEKMRLEDDRNCMYDYIIIKDKMLNQVGPRHCGTYRSPYQVIVRGNKAIITFVSDGSTSKAGFVIKYKGLQNDS